MAEPLYIKKKYNLGLENYKIQYDFSVQKKIFLGNLVRTAVQLAIYMHTPFLSGNSGISGFYKMHMVSFPRMCLIHEPSQVDINAFISELVDN